MALHLNGGVVLAPGDVLLSEYEEELPSAWTDSFARKERGYDVTCALSDAVDMLCERHGIDVVLYDVGPNVGALNRAVLLDCDYFIAPVAADLFSLRALTTVGWSIARWIRDWQTIRSLASPKDVRRPASGAAFLLGREDRSARFETSHRGTQGGRSFPDPAARQQTRRGEALSQPCGRSAGLGARDRQATRPRAQRAQRSNQ